MLPEVANISSLKTMEKKTDTFMKKISLEWEVTHNKVLHEYHIGTLTVNVFSYYSNPQRCRQHVCAVCGPYVIAAMGLS